MEQLCSGFTCTPWPRQETRSQPAFAGFPLHHAVGQQQTTLSCISKSYLAWSSGDCWVKLNADQLSRWFRQFLWLFSHGLNLPGPSWNDGPRISYPLVMTNIAMENCLFIDGLPIKNGWIFPWRTVSHDQMVAHWKGVKPPGNACNLPPWAAARQGPHWQKQLQRSSFWTAWQ